MSRIILIVDDQEELRMLFAEWIRQWMERRGQSCLVLEAGDGHEAVEHVRNHGAIDLVLSDVDMPAMSGPEFYAAVCDLIGAAGTAFWFVTANQEFLPPEGAGKIEKPLGRRRIEQILQDLFTSR